MIDIALYGLYQSPRHSLQCFQRHKEPSLKKALNVFKLVISTRNVMERFSFKTTEETNFTNVFFEGPINENGVIE